MKQCLIRAHIVDITPTKPQDSLDNMRVKVGYFNHLRNIGVFSYEALEKDYLDKGACKYCISIFPQIQDPPR